MSRVNRIVQNIRYDLLYLFCYFAKILVTDWVKTMRVSVNSKIRIRKAASDQMNLIIPIIIPISMLVVWPVTHHQPQWVDVITIFGVCNHEMFFHRPGLSLSSCSFSPWCFCHCTSSPISKTVHLPTSGAVKVRDANLQKLLACFHGCI